MGNIAEILLLLNESKNFSGKIKVQIQGVINEKKLEKFEQKYTELERQHFDF